jgi:hypothetical protein
MLIGRQMKLQILFIILLFISTQSCGLRNHNECGIRALKFFESKNQIYKNLIQKYPETFQASLTFPDWVKINFQLNFQGISL